MRNKSTEKKFRIQQGFETKIFLIKSDTLTTGGGAEENLRNLHCLEASFEVQLLLTLTELTLNYNVLLHIAMQNLYHAVINDIPEVWTLVSAGKKK